MAGGGGSHHMDCCVYKGTSTQGKRHMKAETDTRTLGPERGKLGGTVIQDTWESESRGTGVFGYFGLHLNKIRPIHICICECLHMHI